MNYIKNHLAFVAIIVLCIIVLAFAGLVWVYSVTDRGGDKQSMEKPKEVVTKKNIPVEQTPDKFPKDVPIEDGAVITQNYNATAVDGRFQATRTFETTKTLDANYKIYQDYMKNNDWEVKANVNTENYKMLLGVNGTAQLQVSINENSVTKVKTVDISLTDTADVKGGAITPAKK